MSEQPTGGEPPIADMPATSWAVLGILSFEDELSGYDVKRWADQSLAFFYWAPSHSQIYAELRRLESLGLASSRVEQTHAAKSRRLYAITDAGRDRMREWADELAPESVMLKHAVLLRVWGAHNGRLGRLRDVLEGYRDDALGRAERAAEHAENAEEVPAWHYSSLALEWASRYHRDEAARIDWLLERLGPDFDREDEE
ncbi:PadR family transcriptional regulator [Agromyces sp. NPDC058484]|uniref:PadR family transcriptional regulator n=1 Tax=Agromyces sp. NPDC058484 TaxID=3346524 RepID=UPI00364FE458